MPSEVLAPDPTPVAAPPAIEPEQTVSKAEAIVTLFVVVAPAIALVYAIIHFWGNGIELRDILIAAVLYVVVGYGITVGYHRMLTHRSFTPTRALKVALAVVGSLAVEGGPIGWVADHRRHHAFSDRAGDPHSPHRYGDGLGPRLHGLWHAHTGWLFNHTRTSWSRYARDMTADRDLVIVDRLFPLWVVVSLAIPFGLGYAFGHSLGAALTAMLWAGAVRMFLLHHVTWSINSICHWVGRRPFPTKDHSTNLGLLAVPSLGESWHNAHHAFPRSARHGMLPNQLDPSAALIALFERLGWAHNVNWPTPAQIATASQPR